MAKTPILESCVGPRCQRAYQSSQETSRPPQMTVRHALDMETWKVIQVTVVHAVMMMNAAFVEYLLPRTRVLTGSSAPHARDGHVESAMGAQTTFSSFVRSVNC